MDLNNLSFEISFLFQSHSTDHIYMCVITNTAEKKIQFTKWGKWLL